MELRVLKYFLMVAREENITKAAQLLHVTQPTLSRQLMQLEEELGVQLFHRGKHNVTLTEDGMLLRRRAQAEVDEIIGWLTGYSVPQIEAAVQNGTLYGDFFRDAPQLNPDRVLIKGSICGVKLESIEEPLMKEIRYLDKLVDELAKGKVMEKIKRTNK